MRLLPSLLVGGIHHPEVRDPRHRAPLPLLLPLLACHARPSTTTVVPTAAITTLLRMLLEVLLRVLVVELLLLLLLLLLLVLMHSER